MDAMLAQEGSVWLLDRISAAIEPRAGLYKLPLAPVQGDDFGDFIPQDFDGQMTYGWTFPAAFLNADDEAEIIGPELTWTNPANIAPETIYGSFWYDSIVEKVIFSDPLRDPITGDPEPVDVQYAGDKIRLRYRMTLHRCLTVI